MFNVRYLVRADDVSPVVECDFEALAQDLMQGRRSPFSFVYEVSLNFMPWMPAHAHPHLRRIVLNRATLAGILDHIEWVEPNGLRYSAPSRETFMQAVRAGYAATDTGITVYSTEAWFAASASEVVPHDQSGGWSAGKVFLAAAVGGAALSAAVFGIQRYQHNHTPVSLRDTVVRAELYARDEGRCGLCGARVNRRRFHLDHQCPRVRGGEDTRANLHVTHPVCNLRKGALTVDEFHVRYGSPR